MYADVLLEMYRMCTNWLFCGVTLQCNLNLDFLLSYSRVCLVFQKIMIRFIWFSFSTVFNILNN